jgi:hypothetical protein
MTMTKTEVFEYYMRMIPSEIGREIFSYLIPDSTKLVFRLNPPSRGSAAYSDKYDIACMQEWEQWSRYYGNKYCNRYYGDEYCKVTNKNGLYLSRISKKNGKHRYYITNEIMDCIETEYCDRRACNIYFTEYSSKYVGKNIDKALLELLFYG